MPEAITKYAVNSTLGTEDFEPLDKMIKGTKTLVVSDNLYQVIYVGDISVNDSTPEISKDLFRANINGSFKIKFNVYSSYDDSRLIVYKNGLNIDSMSFTEHNENFDYYTTTITAKPKDIISIKLLKSNSSRARINDISIYADIIDGSGITIIE